MLPIRITGLIAALFITVSCGQSEPQSSAAEKPPVNSSVSKPVTSALNAATTWALNTNDSRIGFASVKASELIETHYFSGVTGQVAPTGEAVVEIPLNQVETKIDIRNERMRALFFETSAHPVATIRATINPQDFADLSIGERRQTEITGTLSLHGVEAPITSDAFVTRISETRVEVASAEPVVIFVSDFDLDAGLEKLREAASLPSITASSPVTFSFVFEAQPEAKAAR